MQFSRGEWHLPCLESSSIVSKMRAFWFLNFCVVVCWATPALAQPMPVQPFLAPGQGDFTQVLPPPPADDSLPGRADLDTILQIQRDRTPEQIARAHRVSRQTVFTFAQPVLGEWFTTKNLPRTAAIFEEIDREDNPIVQAAKNTFHRSRPYQRDARVQPVVSRPGMNESYPSGHTTGAAIWGTILAAAFPANKEGFEAQIHETMWCREIGGVHFPTDTEAGYVFGKAIATRMLASPAMEQALAEIRTEAAFFQTAKPSTAPVAPSLNPS